MEKVAKNLQLALMCIILVSTVIAVGMEIKNMFLNQSVTLADLLLMFLYLEVLAMVRVFWDQQSISITLQSICSKPSFSVFCSPQVIVPRQIVLISRSVFPSFL